jgi:hypothetical protein
MRRLGIIASSIASISGPRVAILKEYTATAAAVSLNVSTLPTYSRGLSDITITVAPDIFIWGAPDPGVAFTITGANVGDTVRLVNSGYIIGGGGNGGFGVTAATKGGTALKLGVNITVQNTSTGWICGGGGGGAGSPRNSSNNSVGGGGGAGGGRGGFNSEANGGGGLPGFNGLPGASGSQGGGGGRLFKSIGGGENLSGGVGGGPTTSLGNYSAGNGGYAAGGGASGPGFVAGGGGGWGAPGGDGYLLDEFYGYTPPLYGGDGGSYGFAGGDGVVNVPPDVLKTTNSGALGGKAIDFNGFTCTIIGSQINILGARE